MNQCADLYVRRPDGSPVAIVEVKGGKDLSRDDATYMRQALLSRCPGTTAPFFLMVSQDTGFLWIDSQQRPDAPPSYEFPLNKIVSRYLPDLKATDRLRHSELQLLYLHWLSDLSRSARRAEDEPEISLAEAGFLKAIEGARVTAEELV